MEVEGSEMTLGKHRDPLCGSEGPLHGGGHEEQREGRSRRNRIGGVLGADSKNLDIWNFRLLAVTVTKIAQIHKRLN